MTTVQYDLFLTGAVVGALIMLAVLAVIQCASWILKICNTHADDRAVDAFARTIKRKLAKKRKEGRSGWEDKEQCPAGRLQTMLIDHLSKGDPVDIGSLAMMLWARGDSVAAPAAATEGCMVFKETSRGFRRSDFTDINGEKCSLQESSTMNEDAIWLGIDTPIPKRLVPGQSWQNIDIDPEDPHTLVAGRMHLNREQVAALLPELTAFVKTGRLYKEPTQ